MSQAKVSLEGAIQEIKHDMEHKQKKDEILRRMFSDCCQEIQSGIELPAYQKSLQLPWNKVASYSFYPCKVIFDQE